jgi:hypothetical protein
VNVAPPPRRLSGGRYTSPARGNNLAARYSESVTEEIHGPDLSS